MNTLRVYTYRITGCPRWLMFLMRRGDLRHAEDSLKRRFGKKFLMVKKYRR